LGAKKKAKSPARRKRKNARKNSRKPVLVLVLFAVLVIGGVLGYTYATNPEGWDFLMDTVDSAWDFVTGVDDDIEVVAIVGGQAVMPDGGEVVVHFIDVGQGDSVLVQTQYGSVLIDGGDNHMGERVVGYLRSVGVTELAYVVATHPHADHIGGLIAVLNQMPVGMLIMPPVAHTTLTFERFLDAIEDNNVPLREPVVGSNFSIDTSMGLSAVFTIIAPNSEGHGNLNDYSVGLRLDFGDTSFIFTGDAEVVSEFEMMAAGHRLSADVLYVGHHGSNTSTAQEFLDAVNPRVVVISVGEGNRYGHPHNAVMSRLRTAGAEIYRTDLHGNIAVVSDGMSLRIVHD